MWFKKIETKTRLHNPFRDFALDEIPSEIRFDPLTGQTGRVFNLPYKSEPTDWSETVAKSKQLFCPFCKTSLEKSTPLFPEDLVPGGRITEGDATLIPNLVPFDKYAGVCIITHRHYVPIEAWTPELLKDAFQASIRFLKTVAEKDPSVNFFYINWNFMPPAGSSIVHPHLQPNGGEIPTNDHRLQIDGSRNYRKQTGRDFWVDFMEAEKKAQERFVGEIDSTFWTLNFVPLGFLPDVWCIFKERSSVLESPDSEIEAFLKGVTGVLRYFNKGNISSFNLSLFSMRDDPQSRVNAKICPRLLPRAIGNSDIAYLQMLHNEPFCVRPPEKMREKLLLEFSESN